MPMSLIINGSSPPKGWHSDARYYKFEYPEAQANDGHGQPCRAVGKPTCQVGMEVMPRAVMAWFMAFFADNTSTYVSVTVGGIFNPRTNATGSYTAKMLRPTWEDILSGWRYKDAVIKFMELVAT
jgi:hypothetical protein